MSTDSALPLSQPKFSITSAIQSGDHQVAQGITENKIRGKVSMQINKTKQNLIILIIIIKHNLIVSSKAPSHIKCTFLWYFTVI